MYENLEYGSNYNFSNNSLLDTYSRIIQKPLPIDIIDVNNLNPYQKKANIIALELFKEVIRKKFIRDYNLFYNIEDWLNLYNELNQLVLNYALKSFNAYLNEIKSKDRYIYARDVDDKILVELDTRYSKSYQKKIDKRAKYLAWYFRKSKSVLLMLTLDPSKYAVPSSYQMLRMKK